MGHSAASREAGQGAAGPASDVGNSGASCGCVADGVHGTTTWAHRISVQVLACRFVVIAGVLWVVAPLLSRCVCGGIRGRCAGQAPPETSRFAEKCRVPCVVGHLWTNAGSTAEVKNKSAARCHAPARRNEIGGNSLRKRTVHDLWAGLGANFG